MIANSGMTEEQIIELLENEEVIDSLKTDSKSIVGAINELFQNANNGKELIASAIGEPLNAKDTFSAMSNDINGLLSTFKTNMMNNGVMVESNDKFKSLIDKISTIVEEGGGKGIQIANGESTSISYSETADASLIVSNLNFKPTIIIGIYSTWIILYSSDTYFYSYPEYILFAPGTGGHIGSIMYSNINKHTKFYVNNTGFCLPLVPNSYNSYPVTSTNVKWLAIGVGEEDTTLRDSLADILENKGVDVTEEDDMASLITKVDNISGGLDIISATELPATGRENQICVVTDNPVDAFITTTNFDDTTGVSTDYITLYLGNTASFDATEGTLIELNQGNLLSRYYFVKACQGEDRLDSYYWLNNQWNRLTQSGIYFVENGVERNHDYFGGIPSGSAAEFTTNGLTLLYSYYSPYKNVTPKNTINFSLYDKLDITVRNPDTSTSYYVCVGYASTEHFTSQRWYPSNSTGGNQPTYSNVTDAYKEIQVTKGQTISQTIDISSWTGEGWLFLATYNGNRDLYITDLKLY